jgi:hypothetical protein
VRSIIRIESIYQTGQVGKWVGMHDIWMCYFHMRTFCSPGLLAYSLSCKSKYPYTIQVSVSGGKVNGQTAQSDGAISMI